MYLYILCWLYCVIYLKWDKILLKNYDGNNDNTNSRITNYQYCSENKNNSNNRKCIPQPNTIQLANGDTLPLYSPRLIRQSKVYNSW